MVITSASHAEGRRFEPGRKHSVYLTSAVFDCLEVFMNCFASCILRPMKIFSSHSKPDRGLDKFVPRLSNFLFKNVRLSCLPSSKSFLYTTDHSWTKTILSIWGSKLYNSRPSLMNKLGIDRVIGWVSEWVSAIRLSPKLMNVTSSNNKNRNIMFQCKMTSRKYRFAHDRKKNIRKLESTIGESGYRCRYLPHAKWTLYHRS